MDTDPSVNLKSIETCNQTMCLCVCLQCITLDGHSSPPLTSDQAENRDILMSHGTWSPEFIEMELPSFRPTYLFLVRIPLDIIHECLKLRLEQRPDNGDPSLLSLKQVSPIASQSVKLVKLL